MPPSRRKCLKILLCLQLFLVCETYRLRSFFKPKTLFHRQCTVISLADMTSNRINNAENPYIEDILDRYMHIPGITNLALGSSYWEPPRECLEAIQSELFTRDTQRYGNILGYPPLLAKLRDLLPKQGLDLTNHDIAITAGANQGFVNICLALMDSKESEAIILSPYYFSHRLALQLSQVKQVHICSFNPLNFEPNWEELEVLIKAHLPKMIVITTPGNPTGFVWQRHQVERLRDLCVSYSPQTWLVFDQTYYEFHYQSSRHFFPNRQTLGYDHVLHLFSLSKVFGMPGWRVGFVVYPREFTNSMRKIQDTIPTHATMLSQKLALQCLDTYQIQSDGRVNNPWFQQHLDSLATVREQLWTIVQKFGTVKPSGAFYFLVPLPPQVSEEEAVELLAKKYKILVMLGSPFGAKNYLRVSYGSIPPEMIVKAREQIEAGFEEILTLSQSRL